MKKGDIFIQLYLPYNHYDLRLHCFTTEMFILNATVKKKKLVSKDFFFYTSLH